MSMCPVSKNKTKHEYVVPAPTWQLKTRNAITVTTSKSNSEHINKGFQVNVPEIPALL